MSIKNIVDLILEMKKSLLEKYNVDDKKRDFRDLLFDKDILAKVSEITEKAASQDETHVRSYFHSAMISAYFEITSEDLNNWNYYSKEIVKIYKDNEEYKFFSSFNESKVLEYYVVHQVNNVYRIPNVKALLANNDSNPSLLLDEYRNTPFSNETNNRILNTVKITMKIRGEDEKKVWGDNDIIIIGYPNNDIEKAEAICIISCKTSLRERVYQSIFWATHSRIEGIAKHAFVTLDKGDSQQKSEIGNRDTSTNIARKTRDVLESTMDRVYVLRNSREVGRSYVIKGFKYLEIDLKRWHKEFFGLN